MTDPAEQAQQLRMLEALLFAAVEPLDEASIAARLPDGADVPALLAELEAAYRHRGVNLVRIAEKWRLNTAPDLRYLLESHKQETRKLSRAALETLAIIAYHQPITRAEIEEVRGVSLSKGTLDLLMEIGWVRLGGRRKTPGRPVTYRTSDAFLAHFGLEDLRALPGLEELKAAGLLDAVPPAPLMPKPSDELLEEDAAEDGRETEEAVPPAAE
jgi:segregation and condensation protein B